MDEQPIETLHLIAGEWVGSPSYERTNPARPGDVVFRAPTGGAGTVDDAVEAARAAQRAWASLPAPARGRILLDAAELLRRRLPDVARDLTREEGKTLTEATGEVTRAVDVLRFYGSEGWRMADDAFPSAVPNTSIAVRREPLGVVGIISPWNFPIAIPAWKIAPALISGNAVVVKPAQLTSLSVWHLASALTDAGMPAGVLNVVHGSGSAVGDALVGHADVAAISFTGSSAVGAGIFEKLSSRGARVQLEMGGSNPLVVLDDADPEFAADVVAKGGFALTGQACTATARVICTPGVSGPLTAALIKQAEGYRGGDGLDPETVMGPVVTQAQLRSNAEHIGQAERDGGEVIAGGADADGLFQSATVVGGVRPDHTIAQQEVFGPVVGLIEVADLDEAIAVANGVEYGLSSGIVTNDLRAAHRFADEIQAGVVKINRPTSGLDPNVPFGGVKSSSTNTYREQGAAALDFFTWVKTVYTGV